jgi:CBS domain-containing protein
VVTARPQTTLRELVGILRDENVSGVPVVSGDRVVGVVSATDLLDFEFDQPYEEPGDWPEAGVMAADEAEGVPPGYFGQVWEATVDVVERIHGLEEPDWDRLMDHTVAEVMTPVIFALPPNEDVRSTASYMIRHGIHRVLVMEDDELLGIASASDIVRAVAIGIL